MKQKKRKRLLSLLVTLAMVIGLMQWMTLTAYADGEHTHDGINFVEWTDALAQEQWSSSSRTAANSLPVEAGNYYLTQDVTVTDQWNTPDGTTNLCLGGKTITGKLSESANHDSSVVNIEGDSTLNLYDDEEGAGKIVSEEYVFSEKGRNRMVLVRVVDTFGGTFNMYGGTLCATEGNQIYSGVYVNGGSFTMYGGTIQGARASGVDVGSRYGVFTMNGGTITGNEARQGGGVFVQEDSTFTMNGGNITGNEALATEGKDEDGLPMYIGGQGGGVYVEAGGTFTMAGGSITGNDAQRYGGGVYNTGTFGISGAPEISGNIHTHAPGYQDSDNVYLVSDAVVNVADALANTTPIGITMQAEDVFTSGKASGYIKQFASDSEEFVVAVKGDELMLQHLKHGMSFYEDGATVTAECAWPASCSLPEGKVALTIVAPTLATYGGAGSAAATLEGLGDFNNACGLTLTESNIKYVGRGNTTYAESITAPTNAGTYTAKITVEGQTAEVNYEITKADAVPATVTANSRTYDGTEKPLVNVDNSTLVGGEMQYALGTDDKTAPTSGYAASIPAKTDAGTYYVWYKVKGDDNHKDSAEACVTVEIAQKSNPDEKTPAAKRVLVAKGIASGKTAAKFSWNKVKDADRYVIYFAKCNYKGKTYAYKKVKTVNAKTFKWTKKSLKKNTAYKFYVVAQKKSGKGYKNLAKSKGGHFFTGNSRGKYTNPKSLKLAKKTLTLDVGKSATIKGTVTKAKKGKKLATGHAKRLRFTSSDPGVASVNSKGKVTAKAKGTATIYVQTINGIWKTCKVTVR